MLGFELELRIINSKAILVKILKSKYKNILNLKKYWLKYLILLLINGFIHLSHLY